MAYTPTTWNTGDTITASAMNKIENGIANAGGISTIFITETEGVLDKTWQEIYDALVVPTLCIVTGNWEGGARLNFVDSVDSSGSYTLSLSDGTQFIATSPNDYPVID